MAILPPSRPKITRDEALRLLALQGVTEIKGCVVLGIAGYYSKLDGKPGNARGIYDDAIVVITPGDFRTFNGNCDPSIFRPGVATLCDGVWQYKPGRHKLIGGYPAFRQAGDVLVSRDGRKKLHKGLYGINIHRGSRTKTSSLGCQTLHPDQWDEFQRFVMTKLEAFDQATFTYVKVSA